MSEATFCVFSETLRPTDPIALGAEGVRSYADVLTDVARVAAQLSAVAGERVVVACSDRYHVMLALLALWQRGAVGVMPSSLQPGAIAQAVADTGASNVLHDGELQGLDLRPWLVSSAPVVVASPLTLPAAQTLVVLSTSGSTGAPISVHKTARQLLTEVSVLERSLGQPRPRAVLCTVPARHIYGLLFGVLWPLRMGVPFVRSSPLLPDAIAQCARSHDADVLVAVPAHLNAFSTAQGLVHPLRQVITSGAPLPRATWEALQTQTPLRVTEVLGSTETGGIATRNAPNADFVPFEGIVVSADESGRMLLHSPYLADDVSLPHRADDTIELKGDGSFRWLGRSDGIVKIGGLRVSPAMIEAQARAIAGVDDAAVLTVEVASSRGQALWLAVAARGHDVASIRAALLTSLPAAMLPRRYRVLDRLPRDERGKLSNASLRALFDRDEQGLPDLNGFELIDQQLSAMPARAELRLHVPVDLVYFHGHFDGHPILPGVVQLQCIVASYAQHLWPTLGAPRGARRLKFTRPIAPGEDLNVSLSRVADDRIDFKLAVGDESCANGSLYFAAEAAP